MSFTYITISHLCVQTGHCELLSLARTHQQLQLVGDFLEVDIFLDPHNMRKEKLNNRSSFPIQNHLQKPSLPSHNQQRPCDPAWPIKHSSFPHHREWFGADPTPKAGPIRIFPKTSPLDPSKTCLLWLWLVKLISLDATMLLATGREASKKSRETEYW